MTEDEYSTVAAVIERHTDAIVRGRARLKEYNDELDRRVDEPFEQNRIFSRHYGAAPAEAQTRVIHGVTITTRVLHQSGVNLSDIAGADLLYEIPQRKYVLIQYKQAGTNGRVVLDELQISRLIGECPGDCLPFYRNSSWCGSWYCVMDDQTELVMPACSARQCFAGRKSAKIGEFRTGLKHETFDEMFAKCYAGAPVTVADVSGQAFRVLSSNRLLFSVVEREPIPPTA